MEIPFSSLPGLFFSGSCDWQIGHFETAFSNSDSVRSKSILCVALLDVPDSALCITRSDLINTVASAR